jgi:hypothetical protein
MMKCRNDREERFVLVLALFLLAIWVWVNPAMASEPGGPPDYYPQKYDGAGRIDRLDGEEIVIDDGLLKLTSHSRFATPSSRHAGRGSFRVGSFVGYLLDSDGNVQSLWLLKPAR